MSPTMLTRGVGLEWVTRSAWRALVEDLNDAIDDQQLLWKEMDIEFADLVGNPVRDVELEHVREENFYEGHHPSFVDSPPDRYPNIAVMAYRARPTQLPVTDQDATFDGRLMIESFVKAGPGNLDKSDDPEMETVLNRRAQRMAEAIVSVISQEENRTLGGSVMPIEDPPEVLIANVGTARREEGGSGDRFLWQLIRVEYVFNKHSELK